jgi:hypothetical protein
MNRKLYLQKALDALSQVVANLQAADEPAMADRVIHEFEDEILAEIEAEPRGRDTDDAYEQSVDEGMECV